LLSEEDKIIHYIIPLSMTLLDVFAGATATLIIALTLKVSWIIILLPMLLTVRGDLAGIFVGVLTTNLKMGSIKPQFTENTEEYYGLVTAILSLTASNSVIASIILLIYLGLTGSISNPFGVVSLTILTFYATSLFSIIMTSEVAFFTTKQTSKYATDPDKYVYPIVSIINDILIGVFIFIIALIIKPWKASVVSLGGSIFALLLITITIFIGFKFRDNRRFRKTLKEAYIALIMGLTISLLNGFFLESQLNLIHDFPPLLIAYPAFIALLGNMGVIISSQFTTMLWMGEVKDGTSKPEFGNLILNPRFLSMAKKTAIAGIIMIFNVSLLTQFFYMREFVLSFLKTLIILFSAGTLVFLFLIYPVSVYLSLKLFEEGFDPDNFMISLITTLCDSLGLITLMMIGRIII